MKIRPERIGCDLDSPVNSLCQIFDKNIFGSAVRITGKNLRALGVALQDRTVEFIKPMPERYSSLASDDVSVKTIEIKDKKEQK